VPALRARGFSFGLLCELPEPSWPASPSR
jgi:hypothetical protein